MKKLRSLLLALALCAGLGVPALAAAGFSDVAADSPFAPAIAWAVEQGVTKGTTPTTFGPGNTCTASHILTFLWRAAGRPGDAGEERAAVSAWASGLGIDVSDLGAPCTRAAAVTDIWKAQGSPAAREAASFTDVDPSAPYGGAVSWAVEAGVTNGTGGGAFSPEAVCTRGQIVTFLYRAMAGSEEAEKPEAPAAGSGTLANGKPITEENVLAVIQELLKEYPDGTPWASATIRPGSPSASIQNVYRDYTWNGTTLSAYGGCSGFASLVSDTIFGSGNINPARSVPFEAVRPGDIIIIMNSTGGNEVGHVEIAASRITGADDYHYYLEVYSGNTNSKVNYREATIPKDKKAGFVIWTRYTADNKTPWSGNSTNSSPSTPTDSSSSGSSAAPGTGPSIPDLGILDAPCGLCGKTGGGSVLNDAGTRKVCSDCHNHNRAAAIAYLNS